MAKIAENPAQRDHAHRFTREEKLVEIAREIAFRRNLYPKWIKAGKIKLDDAGYRIAIMLEIAKDYGGHGDLGGNQT
jgi:hypothetical protein